MKICVIGLGYVGAVSAACIASSGHKVVGVDNNPEKVDLINSGLSPIIEKDLDTLIKEAVEKRILKAQTDIDSAIQESELSLVCVGTPSQLSGNLDLSYVRRVCEQIGSAIKKIDHFHSVVIRSTMLPGTMQTIVIPLLEEFSAKKVGVDFGLCINPEFLREGSAIYDYFNPPKIVIGESDTKSGDLLADIYKEINASLVRTDVHTAEMVKYADNAWHALKVGFANEIGNISKAVGIDGREVMNIFCMDEKLNLSSYYMKPGFAFGGSCLPKDLRALTYKAKTLDLTIPILSSVLPSNKLQVEHGINLITSKNKKKVGILGFSFKAGTDDLRESPIVEVIEYLIGKGYDLKLYDKNVKMASIVGANKNYILNHIPHISNLMVESIDDIFEASEIIVIGNNSPEFPESIRKLGKDHIVIDLTGIDNGSNSLKNYEGICW